MHDSSFADAARFVNRYLDPHQPLAVADVGAYSVNGCLRPLFSRLIWGYTGIDRAAGPNVDVVLAEDYDWREVATASFDVAVSTSTLEHVAKPWRWLPEFARIVKPGGLLYVNMPNTWAFHEYPVDCWRAWPDGLRALFADFAPDVGIVEAYTTGPDTTIIGQKSSGTQGND